MFSLLGTDCGMGLGMASGEILNSQLLASTSRQGHHVSNARLYYSNSWCADLGDKQPYLQVYVRQFRAKYNTLMFLHAQ